MTDDLQVLEPAGSSVSYRGEQLDVRPLTIGQLPKLVRVARPVIDHILALEALPDDNNGAMLDLVLDMIGNHGEAVFAAAAIATGRDEVWIAKGDPAEFIELAKTVVEVNKDFFVQKLAPLLAGRAKVDSLGGGPTPSGS